MNWYDVCLDEFKGSMIWWLGLKDDERNVSIKVQIVILKTTYKNNFTLHEHTNVMYPFEIRGDATNITQKINKKKKSPLNICNCLMIIIANSCIEHTLFFCKNDK